MPRRKIEIKKIEDKAKKQVTFSKRRKGLFKKAKELSIMCGAEVGIIAISDTNRLYTSEENGNPTSIDAILERWETDEALENLPLDSVDVKVLEEKVKRLRIKCAEEELIVSQMQGKNLGKLSMEQLNQLEEMQENALKRLKAKERECYENKIAELQNKLAMENVVHQEGSSSKSVVSPDENREDALDLTLKLENVVHQEGSSSKSVVSPDENREDALDLTLKLENVVHQEGSSSKSVVSPDENSEDALDLTLKLAIANVVYQDGSSSNSVVSPDENHEDTLDLSLRLGR